MAYPALNKTQGVYRTRLRQPSIALFGGKDQINHDLIAIYKKPKFDEK